MTKKRRKVTAGLYDAYYAYKKEVGRNGVDRKLYSDLCQEFNKRISDKMITESLEFRMPYRLGFLRVKAIKQEVIIKDGRLDTTRMPIDWPACRDYWNEIYPDKTWEEIKQIPDKKLIVHTNEHTDGYLMKWYWDRRQVNIKNYTAYKYFPVKGGVTDDGYFYGRRGLSTWVKSDERNNHYYE